VSLEPSDAELLARVRSDAAALDLLYRRHVKRVGAYAARRCREPQDAADLVAATFVTVIDSAHTFDPKRGEASSWILGIAANLWANRGRRAFRERELLARSLAEPALDDDEYARIERQIDASRESRRVEAALATLDPRQCEALLLVGQDGLSDNEAAAVAGVAPAAFRMRLTRARRALAHALAETDTPPLASTAHNEEAR
jgi:RNA polymerase sigma-70 factor (ECF subfamily)